MKAWTGVLDPAAPGSTPATLPDSTLSWFHAPDRRWRFAFDGRLDNRAELIRRYGLAADASDGAVAGGTLAIAGAAGLARSVGDFVLAAWDVTERRLFLARDSIGFRPLFHTERGGCLWWSTDLEALVRAVGHAPRINEGFIAEYLVDAIASVEETPFDGVTRLPPGHLMQVTTTGIRTTAYWSPPTSMPARRPEGQLIEEFRALLRQAVAEESAGATAVAAQLSGGLDSTSVFALAALDTARAPRAYSMVFPGIAYASDGEVVDESPFIDAALAAIPSGGSWRHDAMQTGAGAFLRVLTAHGDLPEAPNADPLIYPLAHRAAGDGCEVMLTGLGGDMWLTGSAARVPQLVRRGRLLAAWGFLREATAPRGIEASLPSVLMRVAAMLTPAVLKAPLRRWRPPRRWPAWISPALIRRTALADRLDAVRARVPAADDLVLRDSLTRFYAPEALLARESAWRTGRDAGIHIRHPFYDARLVSFVMTLPDDLRFRHGESRFIVRRALADLLPRAIAERRSKGDATLLCGVAVNRVLAGTLPSTFEAVRRGWIEDAPFRAAVAASLSQRNVADPTDGLIWQGLAAGLWAAGRA